ncbi:hypothetical protein ADU37_CDS12440 [Thermococcus sp. 2319x1]|nr:hypothetical protein ADU37_CDS12440 [Thermococcus sp. 2319x1]
MKNQCNPVPLSNFGKNRLNLEVYCSDYLFWWDFFGERVLRE